MRLFVTGYVASSHGLDGTFKVKSASGETAHITRLKQITLRKDGTERLCDVEKAEAASGCVLMKVRGIDTAEAAKEIVGSEVVVPENMAHKCLTGEWYVDDLCGCEVMYEGKRVGCAVGVAEGSAASLIEVEIDRDSTVLDDKLRRTSRGKARRVMIPFSEEHIGCVNTEQKRMELRHLWVLE